MSNNIENVLESLKEFIASDERVVLIKGTNQIEKHKLVLDLIRNSNLGLGLFRTNSLQQIPMFFKQAEHEIRPSVGAGIEYSFYDSIFYFDSLSNKSTWKKTPSKLDFAMIYPLDSFCRTKENVKIEFINDLFNMRKIKKIFIVTWVDNYDYSWLSDYIDKIVVFDS